MIKGSLYIYEIKHTLVLVLLYQLDSCFTYEIMEVFYRSLMSDGSVDIFKETVLIYHKTRSSYSSPERTIGCSISSNTDSFRST